MVFNKPAIYETTYKGQKYIGQHIGNGRDYVGSGVIIKNIIKSGNKHKLKTRVIEFVKDVSKIDEREIYWIKKIKPELNIAPGGEGGDHSMFFTKESRQSMGRDQSGSKNSMYGKTHTAEVREIIRQKNKVYHTGRKKSKSHRENLRLAALRRWAKVA